MDNDRWPAFLGGLILGVLVTLGLVGTFGWHKFQQAKAEALDQAARAAEEAERARDMEQMARMQAEQARHAEEKARRQTELAHEAVRKQVDEVLKNVGDIDPKNFDEARATLREAAKKFQELADPNNPQ
jgi:uncharacterized protein HemX